ncbi:MAG: class I SAM-dependent methyltransferase [Anaerolineales bacterium]|jgi:ubiquinone/menaquinone biosynthesis C-methylase UbiE
MNEKRFDEDIARLRNPERLARLDLEWVVSLCLESANIKSLLDVGTGTGVFAQEFSKRGVTIFGVDVNHEMLPAARTYVPFGKFLVAAAEKLPYADASFDLVFMGLLLHESDEQVQVLREAHRVARIRVGILEWAYREEDFGAPLVQRLAPKILIKMAREAGFNKIEEIALTKLVFYRLTS